MLFTDCTATNCLWRYALIHTQSVDCGGSWWVYKPLTAMGQDFAWNLMGQRVIVHVHVVNIFNNTFSIAFTNHVASYITELALSFQFRVHT